MQTTTKKPVDYSQKNLDQFKELVLKGEEVMEQGLETRIRNAKALTYTFNNGKLAGIAGLKRPEDSYRERLSEASKFDISKETYPYELGWIFVEEEQRGNGVARKTITACLADIEPEHGVFATARKNNTPIQQCLSTFGFKQAGCPYKNTEGDELVVYTRPASKADQHDTPAAGQQKH